MNYIEELKNKLDLEGLNEAENCEAFFHSVAEILLNHVFIAKKEKLYEIIEIEFYLFSPIHPDVITYPRQIKGGQWFFHQSGVDLSFKSNANLFGGILIRGIREHKDDATIVTGPLKCVDELWDNFDAFNAEQEAYPHIIKCEKPLQKKISEYPRYIPVSSGQTREEKIEKWIKRLPEVARINLTTPIADLATDVFDKKYRFMAE